LSGPHRTKAERQHLRRSPPRGRFHADPRPQKIAHRVGSYKTSFAIHEQATNQGSEPQVQAPPNTAKLWGGSSTSRHRCLLGPCRTKAERQHLRRSPPRGRFHADPRPQKIAHRVGSYKTSFAIHEQATNQGSEPQVQAPPNTAKLWGGSSTNRPRCLLGPRRTKAERQHLRRSPPRGRKVSGRVPRPSPTGWAPTKNSHADAWTRPEPRAIPEFGNAEPPVQHSKIVQNHWTPQDTSTPIGVTLVHQRFIP